MGNTTWDIALFEALNFDGGAVLDWLMSAISGVVMWLPLYTLIIYMVWRRYTWYGVAVFIMSVAVAMGMADIIAGIFKHSGLLKDLWPDFPVRLRPMFNDLVSDVHVVSYKHGLYGTVSAHAATIVSLTLISSCIIARRWFTTMMIVVAVLVCYSRIYLACHFPQDILIGTLLGLLSGGAGVLLFRWTRRRFLDDRISS
jgi:undecaprenyl-diphosphatase